MKPIFIRLNRSLLIIASTLACSRPGVMQSGECVAVGWGEMSPLAGETFSGSYVESPELLFTGDMAWLVGAPLLVWDTAGGIATVKSGDSLSVHFAAARITTNPEESVLRLDEVVPLPGGVWRMAHVKAAPQPNGAIAFAFVIPETPGTTNATSRQEVMSSSWSRNSWTTPRPVLEAEASADWSSVTVSSVSSVNKTPTAVVSGSRASRGALFFLTATNDGWKAKAVRQSRRLYPQMTASSTRGELVIAFVDADPVTGIATVFVTRAANEGDSIGVPKQVLPRSSFPAYSPQLLRISESTIALLWLERRGVTQLVRLFTSLDDGLTWQGQDSLPVPFETNRVSAVSSQGKLLHIVMAEEGSKKERLLIGSWNRAWSVHEWRQAGQIVGYPAIARWHSGLVLLWSEMAELTRNDDLPRTHYRIGKASCSSRLTE